MARTQLKEIFNPKYIKGLNAKEKKYTVREPGGLGVQVHPSGLKQFVCVVQYQKEKMYVILGPITMSLDKARDDYRKARGLAKQGIDPRAEKQAAALKREEEKRALKAAEIAAAEHKERTFEVLTEMEAIPEGFVPVTVEQLAAVWCVQYSRANHSARVQYNAANNLKNHLIPTLGQRLITEVKHKDVVNLVRNIAEVKATPGAGANLIKYGRQIFNFGVTQEWASIQPFVAVVKSVPTAVCRKKKRHLKDKEIIHAWKEIDTSSFTQKLKNALKLILVTMQRPGEVVQMRFDQIDGRVWTIPEEVAKNDWEHRVFLTDEALALIGTGEGYVFPSSKSRSGHLEVNSLSQAIGRSRCFGMKPWTPHDLRRTGRTHCPRFGVSDEIGEALLNHVKPGIVATYNQYSYDKEKQEALIAWEKFLLELLGEHA